MGSSNIGLMLIVEAIFFEPVIDVDFEVDVVTEVSGSTGGGEELCFFWYEMGSIKFFVGPCIILGNEAKGKRNP